MSEILKPLCPFHPSAQIVSHCSICHTFLCFQCISSHFMKTGHYFSGKDYEQYLLELAANIEKEKENKIKLYSIIDDLACEILIDLDESIVRKANKIKKICNYY